MERREAETERQRQLGQTDTDIERGECVCGGERWARGGGGGGGGGGPIKLFHRDPNLDRACWHRAPSYSSIGGSGTLLRWELVPEEDQADSHRPTPSPYSPYPCPPPHPNPTP